MRYVKRIGIGIGAFFLLYTLVGFSLLPTLLKSLLTSRLSEAFHRRVTIEDIKINPYRLTLNVKGFQMEDLDKRATFLSFDRLFINLQGISLLRFALLVEAFQIERPYLRVVYHGHGRTNFSDLMGKGDSEKGQTRLLPFVVQNIEITDVRLELVDIPKNKIHTLKDAHMEAPFLSSLSSDREKDVLPSFEGTFNGAKVVIRARTKPFTDSLETHALIRMKGLDIPFYLPYLPMGKAPKISSASLDTEMKVSFSMDKTKRPILTVSGDAVLQKAVLEDEKGGPLFRLPRLEISLAPSRPLNQEVHISKVVFNLPELFLERSKEGVLNVLAFFPGKEGEKEAKGGGSERADQIKVDELKISDGKVSFSDLALSDPFMISCNPFHLTIHQFSTAPDGKATYSLFTETDAGERVEIKGAFSIHPIQVEGRVDLEGIKVPRYAPYYRDMTFLEVVDSSLEVHTGFSYRQGENGGEAVLSDLSASLGSLRLKRRGEKKEFLSIPKVSVEGAEVDITKREASIGKLFTEKGLIRIRRNKDGNLSLLPLFPPERSQRKEGRAFSFTLKEVLVDQYSIVMKDMVPSPSVTFALKEIRLHGEDIATGKGEKCKIGLGLQVGPKGLFSAKGTIGMDPLFADLDLDLKGIDIRMLQPYFADKVNFVITGGEIATSGRISADHTKEKEWTASFRGETSINHFSSIDKQNGEDLLKWESLFLSGIDCRYNPTLVKLKEIALSNFYSNLIINPDGSLNLQRVLVRGEEKRQDEAPSEEKQGGPLKGLRIDRVTLQGGEIHFHDRHIRPNYSAVLLEIGGRVSGLVSEEGGAADVHLAGKLDRYGPLEITGKINPIRENLFVDLKIGLKDFEVSPLSPYSRKYIGYTIEKGKLHLELKYRLLGKRLESESRIFLDQFTLGNRVESPDATKLPVGLAISLLKDGKGEITLDLPVSGNLDDPEFSIGKVIIQMLKNLLVKIATSPFALLESLFGGGEKLSHLEFGYGSVLIDEQNVKKLDTLIHALSERPGLKLDIEGCTDREKDREALREVQFNRKLKVQKLKTMTQKGQPPVPVDGVEIEPEEYPLYLKLVYIEEPFPKPRTGDGLLKDLPLDEMKKLIMTYIEVEDDDLRLLAQQRAEKVRDYIVGPGKVDAKRVFLIEPKSISSEEKGEMVNSRVNFRLK